MEFIGEALQLDNSGIEFVTEKLGIKAPELWAVISVETNGRGFLKDRRPVILFERHIFHNLTNGVFGQSHSNISNKIPGMYGAGGPNQYLRLSSAISLNRKAALQSTSWGIGQVMGFNAEIVGFSEGAESMVTSMMSSESTQLIAMANFIKNKGLHSALRTHNWPVFARGYNGANFAINKYDVRLANAFHAFSNGLLPDILVRSIQIYLSYLGFNPGPVDGINGQLTLAALNDFLSKENMSNSIPVSEELLQVLKEKVNNI